MRNILIFSLVLALAFPSLAPAQTFSPEQESQIKTIIQQITDLQIQILLARIEELKAQIAELLTQQTMPIPPTPLVTPPTIKMERVVTPVTVSLGTPYCNPNDANKETAILPVTILGSDWEYGFIKADSPNYPPTTQSPRQLFTRQGYEVKNVFNFPITSNLGETTISVELGKNRKFPNDIIPIPEYTFTDTIVVGNVCGV